MTDDCDEPEYSDDSGSTGESDSGEGVRDLTTTHVKIWWVFFLLAAIVFDYLFVDWIAEEHRQIIFLAAFAYIGSTILEVAAESVAPRTYGLISRATDWVGQPGSQDKEQVTKTRFTGSAGFLSFVTLVSLDVLLSPLIPDINGISIQGAPSWIVIILASVYVEFLDADPHPDMRRFARLLLIFFGVSGLLGILAHIF